MFGLRGHEPSDNTIPWYQYRCVAFYLLSAEIGARLLAGARRRKLLARTMADGPSTPTDPGFFSRCGGCLPPLSAD